MKKEIQLTFTQGKIVVPWCTYELMVNELAKQIKKKKKEFDGIYGIPRGGLPIAISLSHKLNISILQFPTENTLIVDDISDTGKTLQKYENNCIATLYSTKWTKIKPNYYVSEKHNKKDWIVFPWELK